MFYMMEMNQGANKSWSSNRMRARRKTRRTRRVRKVKKTRQRGGNPITHTNLFKESYTINLAKNHERWAEMQRQAKEAGIDMKRWDGVIIKKEDAHTLPAMGVGTTHYKNRGGKIFNLGVIGAYLAHKNLFDHLSKNADPTGATFISEDDIHITSDFHARLLALEEEIKTHAGDWDILFLDKNTPTVQGNNVSPHLIKLDKDMTGMKNWGIWSYVVRNDSIGKKILPCMEHMLDVPDIHLAKFADKINMYLITPPITYGHPGLGLKSVVNELEIGD